MENIINYDLENKYLKYTTSVIKTKVDELGIGLASRSKEHEEFQNYKWSNNLDKQELISIMTSSNMDFYFLEQRDKYLKVLRKIMNSPYFGSMEFEDSIEGKKNFYIGITYLEDEKDQHLIYDWRSPICSVYYENEVGNVSYQAPEGVVEGFLHSKKQFKIIDGKIKYILDNSLNINDEMLQEVLASESSDKMKNIVNTIQQEQNQIIRNIKERHMIVQGIAGSGKTSVALHRIAFLLYKLENLSSSNVLIFSPNQIFTDYISNVLPELGEDNTMQTTFSEFLHSFITEYKSVETFTDFLSRHYKKQDKNFELIKYKQSDEIIKDIEDYVKDITVNVIFTKDINENKNYYTKAELNDMFHGRYRKLKVKERLQAMATKLSEINYNGSIQKRSTYLKLFRESINIDLNIKKLYKDFLISRYFKYKHEPNLDKNNILYEDALLFVYLKCLIEGFPYNNQIKEVVIDEAQDYNKLQYKIITSIFKKCGFTILGDINQTINPYYLYKSLAELKELFNGESSYVELTKTYRSSAEIIEYTNEILGLNFVSAIRKENHLPVYKRKERNNLRELLSNDIKEMQKKYKSIAIITKDDTEAEKIYELLKRREKVNMITNSTEEFNKELVVIPAYIAKGLEFDSVIVYNEIDNNYKDNEKYLYYVACTRAQHQLIVYN